MQLADFQDLTTFLGSAHRGDSETVTHLYRVLFPSLRRMAGSFLRNEYPNHTLQPTILVHDAFIRLLVQQRIDWRDRAHFFRTTARQMRQSLVAHARSRKAKKRAGGLRREELNGCEAVAEDFEHFIILDDLLRTLQTIDARAADVFELSFFWGLHYTDIAKLLQISEKTVERDWEFVRAWFSMALKRS